MPVLPPWETPAQTVIFLGNLAPQAKKNMLKVNVPKFIKQEDMASEFSIFETFGLLDYRIWASLKGDVYKHRFRDEAGLKGIISREWEKLPQVLIDASIVEFCNRLEMVVGTKGDYI